MTPNADLADQFVSPNLNRERVRAFADHISAFEVRSGLSPKKVLVNGIPPFDDVPTVEFEIPKADLASVIAELLNSPEINPNILINGIPAAEHYQVKVIGRP